MLGVLRKRMCFATYEETDRDMKRTLKHIYVLKVLVIYKDL